MRIFPSLHKHLKTPSFIGFAISLGVHLLGLSWVVGVFSQDTIAQVGSASITMSLASINTNAPQKTYSKPTKPKHAQNQHHKQKHKTKHPIPTQEILQDQEQRHDSPLESKQTTHKDGEEIQESASNQDSQGSTQELLAHNEGISDEFYAKVQAAIARKHDYPQLARIRGMQGTVVVEFCLKPDGSLEGLRVVRSNTGDILNKQAIQTIQAAHKSFPKPSKIVLLSIPINYGLIDR